MKGFAGRIAKMSSSPFVFFVSLFANTCISQANGDDWTSVGPDEEVIGRACRSHESSPIALSFHTLLLGTLLLLLPIDSLAAPAVTSHQPASGASVPLNFTAQATFSESLDPGSITTGNFTLYRIGAPVIAAGGHHTVALKSDNSVAAWGSNSHDQTSVPAGLVGVTAVAAGGSHSVALKSDGTVVAWGDNGYGQTAVPSGLSGVIAVSAAGNCTLALKGDGTVVAWGDNASGQCMVPSGLSGVAAIATGESHAVALKKDGTLVAWGENSYGQATVPADLSDVVAIAAGRTHTVALKRNGTVVAWGDNTNNQTGVPAGLTGVFAIAAGHEHCLALRNDGTVIAWGGDDSGQTAVPATLSGAIAIAGGGSHSVALKYDGTVEAWGGNDFGEISVPSGLCALAPVVGGSLNYDPATLTVTFTPSGPAVDGAGYRAEVQGIRNLSGVPLSTAVGWGFMAVDAALLAGNGYIETVTTATGATTSTAGVPTVTGYRPADGATVPVDAAVQATFSEAMDPTSMTPEHFKLSRFVLFKAISAGTNHTLALKDDGTVLDWGDSSASAMPAGLSGVKAVSAGYNHSLAVKNDGTVVAWGNNEDGQATVPANLYGVTAVSAGYAVSAALKSDGQVVTWGWNYHWLTEPPLWLGGVTAIATGGYHVAALLGNGLMVTWGYGDGTYNDKAVTPQGISGITAIAAGFWHTLALKSDGTVVGWRTNGDFISVPAGLSGVKAIAAGPYHNAALKHDGTVVIWGNGEVSVSAGMSGISAISAGGSRVVALKNDGTVIAWGLDGTDQTSVPAGLTPTESAVGASVQYDPSSRTATLTPSAPFLSGVTYFANLTGVLGHDGTPLAETFRWSFTTVDTKVVVSPTYNDFGQVIIAREPPNRSFTIGNPGAFDLAVNAITIEGPDAAVFSVTPGTCESLTPTLTAGGSCMVNVAFAPTTLGTKSATLRIVSNATANPTLTVTLSGSGVAGFDLTVGTTGTGTGIISYSNGGSCAGTCSQPIISGTTVVLTPNADSNSIFTDWSGCDSVIDHLCFVTMTGARSVTATFILRSTGNAPEITAVVPAQGATVPDNVQVRVTFAEPLDPASVTASTFTVSRFLGASSASAGELHSMAVQKDGTVVAWGWGGQGQTAVPAGLTGVAAVAAGGYHSLALKKEGTVTAWGAKYTVSYGNVDYGQTTVPAGLTGVTAIAAGLQHSVALKGDGSVAAWGQNGSGQTAVPADLANVEAVTAGYFHTVALKKDGTVVAWGDNGSGQRAVPAALAEVKAVSAGAYHTVALKNDGSVVAWGSNYHGQTSVPAGLSGVTAIAAGFGFTLALKNDGTVVAWGKFYIGYYAGYGPAWVPPGLSGVAAIAAGSSHAVAVKYDGSVVAWGYNGNGEAAVPAALTQYLPPVDGSLSYDDGTRTATFTPSAPLADGATYYACITDVRSREGVPLQSRFSWSFTSSGPRLSVTPSSGDFGNVFVGEPRTQTFTIRNSGLSDLVVGSVTLAGADAAMFNVTPGTCYGLATTVSANGSCTVNVSFAPAATGSRSATLTIASNAGGSSETSVPLTGTGLNGFPLTIIGSGTGKGVISYSTGGSCAGNCTSYFNPGAVVVLTPVGDGNSAFGSWSGCDSVAGNACTVTMSDARSVTASFARLLEAVSHEPAVGAIAPVNVTVRATFSDPLDPATVTAGNFTLSLDGVPIAIAAGRDTTVALKNDGTVAAWGSNICGQTTVPADLTEVTAVSEGGYHTVALKKDGTVVAWGNNGNGETTIPAGLAGVSAVAAGTGHTVALKNDRTVVAWGSAIAGKTTVPAGLTEVTAVAAGAFHTVALKGDGTVVAWGDNYYGQTTVPAALAGVTAIAAGDYHTVALKSDGTVVALGDNRYGQSTVPAGLDGVTAIAAGDYYTVALKSDGTVITWGSNDHGQTSVPAGLTGVVAVAAGRAHTVALKSDGSIVAWGDNGSGQSTIPVALSPGGKSVSGTLAYDPASLTATFTPSAPLSSGVTYYATVKGVTSQTGLPLAAPVRWSFTAWDMIDVAPPRSSIERPLPSAVLGGTVVAISGTATDGNGYGVQKVEVSTDGGTTWHTASGTTSWRYLWTLPANGQYTIKSRATDVVGNSEITTQDVRVTVESWTDMVPIRTLRLPALSFDSFQTIYSSALDDDIIQSQALSFYEDITFNRNVRVHLKGGYDGTFSSNNMQTTINGVIRVSNGTVKMENLRFK